MFLTEVLLAIVVGCVATSAQAEYSLAALPVDPSICESNNGNYRLPNNTHPETYDLSLYTRVDQNIFHFNGMVRIGIVVDQPTNEIVLHAKQLVVSNVRLFRIAAGAPKEVGTLPPVYEAVSEFLRIRTDNVNLLAGDRLSLEITYSGTLRTDSHGLFRTSYTNTAGKET